MTVSINKFLLSSRGSDIGAKWKVWGKVMGMGEGVGMGVRIGSDLDR